MQMSRSMRRLAVACLSILLWAISALLSPAIAQTSAQPSVPAADCHAGSLITVVAHLDDDLLFVAGRTSLRYAYIKATKPSGIVLSPILSPSINYGCAKLYFPSAFRSSASNPAVDQPQGPDDSYHRFKHWDWLGSGPSMREIESKYPDSCRPESLEG